MLGLGLAVWPLVEDVVPFAGVWVLVPRADGDCRGLAALCLLPEV